MQSLDLKLDPYLATVRTASFYVQEGLMPLVGFPVQFVVEEVKCNFYASNKFVVLVAVYINQLKLERLRLFRLVHNG